MIGGKPPTPLSNQQPLPPTPNVIKDSFQQDSRVIDQGAVPQGGVQGLPHYKDAPQGGVQGIP